MSQTTDVLIIGGGFAGCFAALACVERGLSATLIERRCYLGQEVTAKLRPWIRRDGFEKMTPEIEAILFPPEEKREIDISEIPDCFSGEIPLFCGSVKKGLLSALLENGVKILLMSDVAGVVTDDGNARGLLLASKYGLQIIRGKAVLDTSERRKAAGRPESARYTVGFNGGILPDRAEIQVPGEIGVIGNRVRIHPGKNRSCNVLAEFEFEPRAYVFGLSGAIAREYQARQIAADVTRYLVQHSKDFQNALMCEAAAETVMGNPEQKTPYNQFSNLIAPEQILPVDFSCADIISLWESCQEIASKASDIVGTVELDDPDALLTIHSGNTEISLSDCQISEFDDPKLGIPLQSVTFDFERFLPALADCDVLVAGGGTAGACAGIAAVENGADVIVAEINCDLGGTQTLGGVMGYYHGYQGGFSKDLINRLGDFGKSIYGKTRPNRITKMLLYEKELVEKGGRLFLNTILCGAIVRDGKVKGVVAVNEAGMSIITSKSTVDATGDGDVAVFAGAGHTYGNPRNGNVQDYSQWGRGSANWTSRNSDLDVINNRKMSELIRGIIIAHLESPYYDFAPMPTVRESRHIQGEYTLNLIDVYESRSFDDAVAVAKTDWDPHGISSSWLGRLGFMPVHMQDSVAQIPYRCCIPRGLDGLLVSAKAISATTDAACYCRMAPDIQNLGYATGLAAVMAAEKDGRTREIDISHLRERLFELEILPAKSPAGPDVTCSASERVARLADGDEPALFSVVLLLKETAMPLLEAAFIRSGTDKLCLAKALAWFGVDTGLELLVESLKELSRREITPYDDTHPRKTGNPKAGIVDEIDDYWRINQLLALLGILGHPRAVEAVSAVVDKADSGGEPKREANPYIKSRIDMQRAPHFDRLLCIAFALERLADSRFIPAVEKLLGKPYVGGYLSLTNENAGVNYHGAYAEVSLAAAAARCGSVKGAERLVLYLDDIHEILSTFAHQELVEVTGENLGRDSSLWAEWLDDKETLSPVPYRELRRVF